MLKKLSLILLLLSPIEPYAESLTMAPVANDDYASVVVGFYESAWFNVAANDLYGANLGVKLNGSGLGKYGYLIEGTIKDDVLTVTFGEGIYTYLLYDNSANAALAAGQIVTDTFTYTYTNDVGQSTTANIIIQVTGNQQNPIAFDDSATVIPNTIATAEGDVTLNDRNGVGVYLSSSPVSAYGSLVLSWDGSYTYTLYENSPTVTGLAVGELITDSFTYTYFNYYGQSVTAKLNVQIIGNPVDGDGNTIFVPPVDTSLDNVDIEPNNRSADATPLNNGRNIKGHLQSLEDKDWYSLQSAGDEIINLEVCPSGSSCSGKGSWVMYVFDSNELTLAMEEAEYDFFRWADETGSDLDLVGNIILNSSAGSSNHMYLAYRAGFFDGALIGVVDPCFGTSNSVDIGVGSGARDYFIAVSSPLLGDGSDTECGQGSIVLQKPGVSVSGLDATGLKPKTYETTEEYISVFPFSDDQYAIKITGTGINPLQSTTAVARSATFNSSTGELSIPQVRAADGLYQARLTLQNQTNSQARSTGSDSNSFRFDLLSVEGLGPEAVADSFQATYNPANQQILIPRVTITTSGEAYSVAMQYHPEVGGNAPWLEVIDYSLIQ
jgi:VCBS repeat-containing protein